MGKLNECLCCGNSLQPVLDWGKMALANNYNIKEKYPLKLNRCMSCCHLQLDEFVDPEILFKDYPYHSGTSKTSLDYFKEFAETALRYSPNAKNILDIACNDGAQLDAFKELGLRTIGIDPAQNLTPIAIAKGHYVITGMFPDCIESSDKTYDIITAQNVVAHVPDPLSFLKSCKQIMDDDSILMIATSQANMVLGAEYDTLYHEHISYFNTLSMQKLCERASLVLEDVFTNPIHGTSYIFVIKKVKTPNPVDVRIRKEETLGLYHTETYDKWVEDCKLKYTHKKDEIEQYRKEGYQIIGCGAAAKGITFLNISGTQMDLIVDTTPAKWYAETCNTNVYPFEFLKTIDKSDKVLFVILAWNFAKEIKENVLKYRRFEQDVFITTND